MKLGKLPFTPDPKDVQLKSVLRAMPGMPERPFGYGTIFDDWGVLGNDRYGDCVFAGADHEHMLFNHLAKHDVTFTPDNALADYAAVTGFDPSTGNNDNGTVVRDAMNYRRNTGLLGADGKRHKIYAFAQIPPKDWDLMIRCVFTFGVVGMGFEVPNSIWDQWDNNLVWDVIPGSAIEGGHYVPVVGTHDPTSQCSFITWGKKQRMTKAFYQQYNDESWVPITKEELLPATNIRGISWDVLDQYLNSL